MASEKSKKGKIKAKDDVPKRASNTKPQSKSAEFVTESDDESDVPAAPPSVKDTKVKKAPNGVLAKAEKKDTGKPVKSVKFQESSDSSDDSDSSDSSSEAKPESKPRAKPELDSQSEPESESGSGSESESGSESVPGSGSESELGSASESESEAEPSSVSKSKSGTEKRSALKSKSTKDAESMDVDEPVGVKEVVHKSAKKELFGAKEYENDFVAPTGFAAIDDSEKIELPKTVHDVLQEPSLKGKQLWHITAPSYISLQKLQQVSLDAIQKQEAVITHKDSQYYFAKSVETSVSDEKLVIPDDSGFRTVKAPVSRSLHLQQILGSVPSIGAEASDAPVTTTATKIYPKLSPPVQPSGLKMRYQAFGVVEKRKAESSTGPKKKSKHHDKSQVPPPSAVPGDEITPEERARQKAEKKARKEQRKEKKSKKAGG